MIVAQTQHGLYIAINVVECLGFEKFNELTANNLQDICIGCFATSITLCFKVFTVVCFIDGEKRLEGAIVERRVFNATFEVEVAVSVATGATLGKEGVILLQPRATYFVFLKRRQKCGPGVFVKSVSRHL